LLKAVEFARMRIFDDINDLSGGFLLGYFQIGFESEWQRGDNFLLYDGI